MTFEMNRRSLLQGFAGLAMVAGSPVLARAKPPQITFDAHFHILEPGFPLVENQGYLPPKYTLQQYQQDSKNWNATGGAIVSGSYQAFDQTYLIHTLSKLDRNWVGVTQLPFDISDEEIDRLAKARVRGVRFNLKRGESYDFGSISKLAHRVHKIGGMHSEFYADASALAPYVSELRELPRISLDHLGLTREGLPTLLKLVESGARVKASGFGRLNFDPLEVMKNISEINEDALIFGSDVPSTRAKRPFELRDVELIRDNFNEAISAKIFFENGKSFYRI
ncbi:amidohydrolase family protein [Brucella pituitosa]|uniref:amidohydrolase family protein n=1 Tax=Brucella pituitosa TaxID=571256 RepID=UPI003F4AD11F